MPVLQLDCPCFGLRYRSTIFGSDFLRSIFRSILRVLNNSPLMYGSEHFYPEGFYGRICSTQRILHGRAEIRNFSSSVEKYFSSERSERMKYLQHEERNFVSPSGGVQKTTTQKTKTYDLENDDRDGVARSIKRLEGYRRREIRGQQEGIMNG